MVWGEGVGGWGENAKKKGDDDIKGKLFCGNLLSLYKYRSC